MDESSESWARHGGRLSTTQRWTLALKAVALQWRARRKPPRQARLGDLALRDIDPPGDALSRTVLHAVDAVQPPWLTQHALRAYAWGRLLARVGDWRPDVPLLYQACVLHDVGLCEAAAHPAQDCFALRGARWAHQLLAKQGAAADHVVQITRAIGLHLDVEVPPAQGLEAHLLHDGTLLDVVGRRAGELPASHRAAVLARHPRGALKLELCRCMRLEARQAPGTRAALYVGRFGFLDLIERAPFES